MFYLSLTSGSIFSAPPSALRAVHSMRGHADPCVSQTALYYYHSYIRRYCFDDALFACADCWLNNVITSNTFDIKKANAIVESSDK